MLKRIFRLLKMKKISKESIRLMNNGEKLECVQVDRDVHLHFPYGPEIYELILKHKPLKIVEFGVSKGYITIIMALALKELGKGRIIAYDSWQDIMKDEIGSKPKMSKTIKNLEKYGVDDIVELRKKDFWDWIKLPEEFDLFHLDIDNDGNKVLHLYEAVKDQIDSGKIVIFEGGSEERDNASWMKKFARMPITSVKNKVGYQTIVKAWPSLSIIKK